MGVGDWDRGVAEPGEAHHGEDRGVVLVVDKVAWKPTALTPMKGDGQNLWMRENASE
ncbi:MAG: hypothetical protein HOQ04_11275 [Pseudarthrobacter sp.]|nr:hypothetical protein [Pseudarthrobacter sp.]